MQHQEELRQQYWTNHRLADRECRITTLPGECVVIIIQSLDPVAAFAFDFLNEMGYVLCSRQHAQNVDMVSDAAYNDSLTPCLVYHPAEIGMNALEVTVADFRTVHLGVEYYMQIYFT